MIEERIDKISDLWRAEVMLDQSLNDGSRVPCLVASSTRS